MGRGSLWFWMICRLCAAVFSVSECCHTRLLWDKVRILSWRLYKSVFTVTFLRQNSLCCFSNVVSGNIPFECVAHICAKKWNRSVMEMRSPEIYMGLLIGALCVKPTVSSWVLDVLSRRFLWPPELPAPCNCAVLFVIGYDPLKYKEKSRGDGTQPCGTTVLKVKGQDERFFTLTHCCLCCRIFVSMSWNQWT